MRAQVLTIAVALATVALAEGHTARISQIIDQAMNPLPAGFKGTIVGYLDDFGPVYKPYGIATVDGTVAMNEKTMFGIGSASKLFAATLLALANEKGLALNTPVLSLLPPQAVITPAENRYGIRLLDLADHHAGLPKNEGHLYNSLNDLYTDYAADPITCNPATAELIHDCGCCDPVYMSLLGLTPTCGAGVANPVYSGATHAPTQGPQGWLYSNLAFEVLGNGADTGGDFDQRAAVTWFTSTMPGAGKPFQGVSGRRRPSSTGPSARPTAHQHDAASNSWRTLHSAKLSIDS